MKVLISEFHESAQCLWCKKTVETVTAQFDSGFLRRGELCWKCLQQATRVHHKQSTAQGAAKPNKSD